MKSYKKGISLSILVITIVVMAILATTAIVNITGDNIINVANLSLDKNKLDNIREAAQIAYDRLLVKNMGDTTGITGDIIKQKVIEAGIDEQDLEGLDFHIGETIRVGYKQTIGTSTNISSNIPGVLGLKIYGNSVQNGTPTPTSEVPIESVGEKTSNLYNLQSTYYCARNTYSIGYKPKIENNILYSGGKLNMAEGSGLYFKIKKNTYYTFSFKADYNEETEINRHLLIYLFNEITDNMITASANKYISVSKGKITYTFNSNENEYFTFMAYSNTQYGLEFSEIYLGEEENYEPYGYKIPITVSNDTGTTTHNIYLDEPLRKVGNYKDYIDFDTKTVVRQVGEKLLTGIENWQVATATYGYRTYVPDAEGMFIVKEYGVALCNRFNVVTSLASVGDFITRTQGGVQFAQDWAANKTEWCDWVNEHNIIIQYPLAENVTNLIELPEINTVSGNTKITINTEIAPSSVELFYQYN